jgi:hypothetical protein
MSDLEGDILPDAVGLRLCKVTGKGANEQLRVSEKVRFVGGRAGLLTTLMRAQMHGHVGGAIDRTTDFWADQIDQIGDHIGEVRLDRESWNALKNKWMRVRMVE